MLRSTCLTLVSTLGLLLSLVVVWFVMESVQQTSYKPLCIAVAARRNIALDGYTFERIPLGKGQTTYICHFQRIENGSLTAMLDIPLAPGEFTFLRAECLAVPAFIGCGLLVTVVYERIRRWP